MDALPPPVQMLPGNLSSQDRYLSQSFPPLQHLLSERSQTKSNNMPCSRYRKQDKYMQNFSTLPQVHIHRHPLCRVPSPHFLFPPSGYPTAKNTRRVLFSVFFSEKRIHLLPPSPGSSSMRAKNDPHVFPPASHQNVFLKPEDVFHLRQDLTSALLQVLRSAHAH